MIAMALALRAEPAHRRRADDRARRDHPGPDPRAAPPPPRPSSGWRSCSSPTTWASSRASPTGSPSCTPAGSSRPARPRRSWPTRRHPYTVGLLRSLPRLDRPRQAALTPIEGSPPDLAVGPRGLPVRAALRAGGSTAAGPTRRAARIADGERLGGLAARRQHQVACHNQPTRDEAIAGRPLRAGFAPAPPPAAVAEAIVAEPPPRSRPE